MKYDKLLVNGKIFTSDKDAPHAGAMAIREGRIVWIGSDEEAAGLASSAGEIIDLAGKRVLPGFVDCHMHAMWLADFSTQISALPPAINSIGELVRAIAEKRDVQEPGMWIRGWGYDEGKLAEHRAPDRRVLDRGCSDAPVFIMRVCAHICAVNSYALELAGITRETPDPEGGRIGRDENGEPNGILYETAMRLVQDILPVQTDDEIAGDLAALGETLLSQGVTAITDMGENETGRYDEIYAKAAARGFKNRLSAYCSYGRVREQGHQLITSQPSFNSDGKFRISGVKLFGDGSVSGRTAWCDKPYLPADENDAELEYGMPVCSEAEILGAIDFCKEHKCQLSMHVMGEQAIDRAVNLTWKEKSWMPDGIPAVRLEHVAMPTETAMERAAASDMAWVTQPVFVYAEIESYQKNLPEDRIRASYPVARWLHDGIRVALSTDAPATSWSTPSDPFINIKSAVTRKAWDGTDTGQENRIDIETAIRLYTAEAAPVAGFTDVGLLKEGYVADFIVLDRDILNISAEEIDQVQVVETWIDGERVYMR